MVNETHDMRTLNDKIKTIAPHSHSADLRLWWPICSVPLISRHIFTGTVKIQINKWNITDLPVSHMTDLDNHCNCFIFYLTFHLYETSQSRAIGIIHFYCLSISHVTCRETRKIPSLRLPHSTNFHIFIS